MHGSAGTSAVVALVPVTLMSQWYVGLGYLVAFGLETIIAMTAYALVAAAAFRKASETSLRWGRAIGRFAGIGSIVVGGVVDLEGGGVGGGRPLPRHDPVTDLRAGSSLDRTGRVSLPPTGCPTGTAPLCSTPRHRRESG